MKHDAIDKFLMGTADEHEQRRCEEMLADPETVIECRATVGDDSLLSALRSEGGPAVNSDQIQQLAQKIEQLVPRHAVGTDELQRLLDPPVQAGDVGQIGRYRITEFLAAGGMGLVFRGIDPDLDRPVCIKLLNPGPGAGPEAKSRFDREVRAAARMTCERIMPVLEVGMQRELPFFVMPMLEGMSLRTLLSREQRLAPERAIQITRQIAEGLEYAHQRDVLHRDIKPDNLWVTSTGDIKLLDFGLARTTDDAAPITKAGTVLGTPSYMSPEQVTGKPLDGRSDLFSVGAVLVEMLTGQSPFQKSNLFSTLMSVAGEEIQIGQLDPDGGIPAGLRDLVQRLLKKNPDERTGSARELIESLDRVGMNPHQSLAQSGSTGGFRWWKTVAAVLFGFAACLGGLAVWNATDRGTLVVQTRDPDVEIKIANERVSIHDPVTGRNHEIRIGETPLPSGVYQLETTDTTGDLVFSSQTIIIRRGEKAIVTVELRPAATPGLAESSGGTVTPLVPVPFDPASWADKSFDPVVRDQFADFLTKMPGRELVTALPDQRFGQEANVQQPALLDGIPSWSIESVPSKDAAWEANADGTLFGFKHKLAWIRDAEGTIRYILPVNGLLSKIGFDRSHSNLVAISSWLGRNDIAANSPDQPEHPYEIALWRLGVNGAELVDTIRSDSSLFALDHGYRLIHTLNRQFVAYRLDNSTSHPMPGTLKIEFENASIALDAVSPDGRFLATTTISDRERQLNIHNLQTGTFVGSIPSASSFQWNDNGNEVAVLGPSNDYSPEIWRSDRPELVRKIDPPAEAPDQASGSRNRIVGGALESDFGRYAWLKKDGVLTIRNIGNNRQASISIDGLKNLKRCEISWNRDGTLDIRSSEASFQWSPEESDVHGKLSVIRLNNAGPSVDRPLGTGAGGIMVAGQADGIATISLNSYSVIGERTVTQVDLSKGSMREHSEKLPSRGEEWGDILSPNGKYLVRRQKADSSRFTPIDLINLADGSLVHRFGSFIDQSQDPTNSRANFSPFVTRTKWSNDGRFVIVVGTSRNNNPRSAYSTAPIWDTELNEVVKLDTPKYPNSWVDGIVPADSGFHLHFAEVQGRTAEQSWWIDPVNKTAVLVQTFDGFESIRPIWLAGDRIVFSGKRSGEESAVDSSKHVEKYFRGRLDDRQASDLQEIRFHELDQVSFSPDGNYFLNRSLSGEQVQIRGNNRIPVIEGPESRWEFEIGAWPENEELPDGNRALLSWNSSNDIRNVRWHPSSKAVAWDDPRSGFSLFQITTGKARHWINLPNSSFAPLESGWLVGSENRLFALGIDGDLLGTLVFDADTIDGMPANPRWILADGSMQVGAVREGLMMVWCKDDRVYCRPLAEFESDPANPELPKFVRVPFLTSDAGE